MSWPPRETFDWPAFRKTFPFQPAAVWAAAILLVWPASRATPLLLRATCAGPARELVANIALVVYAVVLPPAAAALVYLLGGRRRMTRIHRLMGDCFLALVLLVSARVDFKLFRSSRAKWTAARPGLDAVRAACWK